MNKIWKVGSLFHTSRRFFAGPKTQVKTISISGSAEGPASVKAVFDSNKKTVEASTPLELLLYSLISCENATLRVIAKEQNVKLGVFNFKKAAALYDTKGFFGLDPNNKFSKIDLEMEIQSDATKEKMEELLKLMKKRCPVYNMLKLAGVEINSNYSFKGF